MDLDLLPAFVAFADSLNFTRAAEALHLSQPAVHMQVRKLGESVGLPLYRRVGRRIELTQAGTELARFGRETADRAATFLDELRGAKATRPAVLAAGEGAFLYLLGPAIRDFGRRDRTPLRLLTRDGTAAVDAVRAGEAHLAVAVAPPASEGLVVEELTRVEMVLVMPRDHALARKERVRLTDLRGQRLVVPPTGRPHRVALDEALRHAKVEWEVSVEASGWELMIHFVELGLGLAIVNGCCRIPPALTARALPGLAPVDYRLVRRRESVDHPGAAALLECLRRRAEDWRRLPGAASARSGK
jgi:DNA-binding transcriptional LysR family regulator